jgi:HSP20 family protein
MRTRRNLPGHLVDFPTVVNSLFHDDFFKPAFNHGNRKPAVNIAEDENSYGIEVLAPGMHKDQFNVKIEDGNLIISAEMEDKKEEDQVNYTYREYRHESFKRSFHLPDNEIDEENISANYVDGVLKILLPKREEAKPKAPVQIEIA